MAVVAFTGRPPAEALAFLKDKVPGGRLSFDWRDVWQDEHLTSFVVAKMMSRDLLADVQRALLKALAEGQTREMFIRELRPVLEKAGWWGRKVQTDPLTGLAREVQLGSTRRLTTIFDTNMRMAHAGDGNGSKRPRPPSPIWSIRLSWTNGRGPCMRAGAVAAGSGSSCRSTIPSGAPIILRMAGAAAASSSPPARPG